MARLRQQNPYNYITSEKINAEFENVIRYLNAAEFGDKTLSELLDVLFNSQTGEFDGPIEFMYDGSKGLMYRVGEYSDPSEGWIVIAPPEALRGPPGEDVGMIEGPLYYSRMDVIPVAGTTVVLYNGIDASTDDILVYLNGLLQPVSGVYTVDFATKNVTFVTAFDGTMKLTMYCVRAMVSVAYVRSDQVAFAGQTVFPFANSVGDSVLVYRNGILQQEGGANDYVLDPTADAVIFRTGMSAGDKVAFIVANNPSITRVGGIMTTDEYAPTGLIPWPMLVVNDGEIPAVKVQSLSNIVAYGVYMVVSPTTPAPGDTTTQGLWINTAKAPNQLNFYDGTRWISTSPESEIPPFDVSNANEYLRVNATATAFEYGNIDFSSLIPKSQKGQPNGVATLDASGYVPDGQISPQRSYMSMPFDIIPVTVAGEVFAAVIFMQVVRIEGVCILCDTGTLDAQIAIDGGPVGPVYHVTPSTQSIVLSPMIQVDATTTGHTIGLWISNIAGATEMWGCLSISTLVVD